MAVTSITALCDRCIRTWPCTGVISGGWVVVRYGKPLPVAQSSERHDQAVGMFNVDDVVLSMPVT